MNQPKTLTDLSDDTLRIIGDFLTDIGTRFTGGGFAHSYVGTRLDRPIERLSNPIIPYRGSCSRVRRAVQAKNLGWQIRLHEGAPAHPSYWISKVPKDLFPVISHLQIIFDWRRAPGATACHLPNEHPIFYNDNCISMFAKPILFHFPNLESLIIDCLPVPETDPGHRCISHPSPCCDHTHVQPSFHKLRYLALEGESRCLASLKDVILSSATSKLEYLSFETEAWTADSAEYSDYSDQEDNVPTHPKRLQQLSILAKGYPDLLKGLKQLRMACWSEWNNLENVSLEQVKDLAKLCPGLEDLVLTVKRPRELRLPCMVTWTAEGLQIEADDAALAPYVGISHFERLKRVILPVNLKLDLSRMPRSVGPIKSIMDPWTWDMFDAVQEDQARVTEITKEALKLAATRLGEYCPTLESGGFWVVIHDGEQSAADEEISFWAWSITKDEDGGPTGASIQVSPCGIPEGLLVPALEDRGEIYSREIDSPSADVEDWNTTDYSDEPDEEMLEDD